MRNGIYICGPMTGLPNHNIPAFMLAAKTLRDLGYTVVNPAELHGDVEALVTQKRLDYLRTDIAALVSQCDAVATLPGWEDSAGARLEVAIARELCMTVGPVEGW